METRCKCGHRKFDHLHGKGGSDNRNRCTRQVRYFLYPLEDSTRLRPGDVRLTQEQTQKWWTEQEKKLEYTNNWQRFRHHVARGYYSELCECPMYHTVELGKVGILIPGR